MDMLDCHEFSGTMTYETNLGLESHDFSYTLWVAPNSDEELVETAAKVLAQFIVKESLDDYPSTKYHPN